MKYALLVVLLLTGCSRVMEPLWTEEKVDLGIVMEEQEASNWCWAAVGQAIVNYYGENMTQSEVVSYSFGRECTPETCNGQYNTGKILKMAGLQNVGYDYKSMGVSQEDLFKNRLEVGVPISILLKDRKYGFNHTMLIGGYNPEGFIVYDPAGSYKHSSIWTYDEIVRSSRWELREISYVVEINNPPRLSVNWDYF